MKTRLIPYIALLGALTLGSCSKDAEPALTPTHTTTERTTTISLSGSVTTDNLRLMQEMEPETGRLTRPIVNASRHQFRVFLRYGDTGPVSYEDLWFDNDGSKVSYDGPITLPPAAPGNLQVAAILLQDADGNVFTTPGADGRVYSIPSRFVFPTPGENRVMVKIPYLSTWEEMTEREPGKYGHSFRFRPSGTVVRVRFTNYERGGTGSNIPPDRAESQADFYSTVFTDQWYYDFANWGNPDSELLEGEAVDPSQTHLRFTMYIPETTNYGSTPWQYIHLMPRKQVKVEGEEFHTTIHTKEFNYDNFWVNTPEHLVYLRHKQMGSTYVEMGY